ncbi:hypothetical protein NDU88_008775 [Pleurodeles waltl]|uniref:Uncharacterized protein n=1 Tax=Pleurodeles waltl TaxID=8319 RepID=A0AAV7P4I9_PLEWA|nr:hypothetical protein NDU88_008775 [Pleurodeles waltl]
MGSLGTLEPGSQLGACLRKPSLLDLCLHGLSWHPRARLTARCLPSEALAAGPVLAWALLAPWRQAHSSVPTFGSPRCWPCACMGSLGTLEPGSQLGAWEASCSLWKPSLLALCLHGLSWHPRARLTARCLPSDALAAGPVVVAWALLAPRRHAHSSVPAFGCPRCWPCACMGSLGTLEAGSQLGACLRMPSLLALCLHGLSWHPRARLTARCLPSDALVAGHVLAWALLAPWKQAHSSVPAFGCPRCWPCACMGSLGTLEPGSQLGACLRKPLLALCLHGLSWHPGGRLTARCLPSDALAAGPVVAWALLAPGGRLTARCLGGRVQPVAALAVGHVVAWALLAPWRQAHSSVPTFGSPRCWPCACMGSLGTLEAGSQLGAYLRKPSLLALWLHGLSWHPGSRLTARCLPSEALAAGPVVAWALLAPWEAGSQLGAYLRKPLLLALWLLGLSWHPGGRLTARCLPSEALAAGPVVAWALLAPWSQAHSSVPTFGSPRCWSCGCMGSLGTLGAVSHIGAYLRKPSLLALWFHGLSWHPGGRLTARCLPSEALAAGPVVAWALLAPWRQAHSSVPGRPREAFACVGG